MDPYEVLGLDRNATKEEIKERYESMIEQCTLNQDENTQKKLKIINAAYNMLNTDNIYRDVRMLMGRRNYAGAEAKLNQIKDRNSAEWNYLQGLISVQKGWFETGINYLRRAVELDNNNMEYLSSLNTLQARIIEYATRYATQSNMYNRQPPQNNNMNACGGGNNNGGGGMC